MLRKLFWAGVFAVAIAATAFAETSGYGTAEEAKAMLERAVAALKVDEAKALAAFNDEHGEFRDRDLYVFCANASDGIETAHPTHKGQNLAEVKDANGYAFGAEIMKIAKDGEIGEVSYMWPRPGSDTPVDKVTYVTKVGDQICAVGYYK